MLTGRRTRTWVNVIQVPLTVQASSDRNPDHTHADFAYKLKVQILPNDQENRGEFDNGVDFRIGDPNVHMKLLRILANRTGASCSVYSCQNEPPAVPFHSVCPR